MTFELPKTSVAETLAAKIVTLQPGSLPATTTRKCEDLLIDVVGLCVTARNEDYIQSALAGCDDEGPCPAIGHQRTLKCTRPAFIRPRFLARWEPRPGSARRSASTPGRSSMRSASRAVWLAASSNTSPKAPGRSGCMPDGRHSPEFARHCWRAAVLLARA